MDKPILSLLVLISNRPDTVKKCLDSLQPILDNVPSELILTDTGCGDTVRKIIEKYDATILDFEWCKDFAKARNVGLRVAKGEWFLYVDDDEWFEDTSEIIHFFNSGEYLDYGYGSYVQRNYRDNNGVNYFDFDVTRIHKRRKDSQFEYSIHERVNIIYGRRKFINDYVHHYGYIYNTEEEREAHEKRNLELLEKENKENPLDIQMAVHYAAALVGKHPEKALEVAKRIVDEYRGGKSERDCYIFVPTVVDMYARIGETDKAKEYAQWGMGTNINTLQKAQICLVMTQLYVKEHDFENAYKCAELYYSLYKTRMEDGYRSLSNPLNFGIFEKNSYCTVMQEGIYAGLKLEKVSNILEWFAGMNSEEFGTKANFFSVDLINGVVAAYMSDNQDVVEAVKPILQVMFDNKALGLALSDCLFKVCDNSEDLIKFSEFGGSNIAAILSRVAKESTGDTIANLTNEEFDILWREIGFVYSQLVKFELLDYVIDKADNLKKYTLALTYPLWNNGVYSLISDCNKEYIEKIIHTLVVLADDREERMISISYAYDKKLLQDKKDYNSLMQFEKIDRIYSFAYDIEQKTRFIYSQYVLDNFESYLSDEEVFGLKFIKILEHIEKENFAQALEISKGMVSDNSPFLAYVKDIVQFINEAGIESRFDPQMKELATQIKKKIRELKQNGEEEAALEAEKMLKDFYK